ncbi:fungal-specific transcription factor domain-containing protein [Rhodotorula toruloides]|uniref:Zn(2)-C6 transcription factor n=1 Tax=Rhodotorula toruloides (strain NP11) TaxID=1130832 RepID=M7X7T5_RHOT1|nr:Zn(2)-C6 transcription factor [Rhodotorula toruloides NP11]EMS26155.1 Zn(2)-C6 transcription factor [Rhodotorula toruloides NP11]
MSDSDDGGYSSQSDTDNPQTLNPLDLATSASASSSTQNQAGQPTKAKGKGRGGQGGAGGKADDKEVRKRSSKACDNCRKSKCKCTRILDPATNEPVGPCQNCLTVGAECTFLGASRKRGPPKGYIEAIESRLYRMEALLGGLLGSDDPRAQTLLGELIGDNEARTILARDLKAAASAPDSKAPRRSWKREFADSQAAAAAAAAAMGGPGASGSGMDGQPLISTGFPLQPGQPAFTASPGTLGMGGGAGGMGMSNWLSEEDLNNLGAAAGGGTDLFGSSGGGNNALGFDPTAFGGGSGGATFGSYRGPGGESSEDGASPGFSALAGGTGLSIPVAGSPMSTSLPTGTTTGDLSTSPRQRRRIEGPPNFAGSPSSPYPSGPSSAPSERKQMAYAFTLPPVGAAPPKHSQSSAMTQGNVLSAASIGHTGTSTYSISNVTGAQGGAGPSGQGKELGGRAGAQGEGNVHQSPAEPLTELADVIGQLSLNENAEVRYHGRSSGLYLISKSQRFRDFYWQFPSAGVWPPADGRVLKTEREILQLTDTEDPLPDMQTQTHLLAAYWTYVHPHFPLLYKVSFMRQYRHSLAHPDSTEPSTAAGTGKVPMVLLLSMFALAARYCDLEEARKDGKYWTAGQEYLEKARRILNYDYGSSRLVTVQALLLISYREIGVGAMSSAWMTCGMAIRMAQDLGLFRDVEKWFLPIQRFSHEEKQTRKRIWWACVILDRYTSSYIGRPGTIHERDYDCGFPSEDEPDEHEQWRPIRVDGTEWTSPPRSGSEEVPDEVAKFLKSYPPTRAHTLSCFNAAGALAVIINRIIINIYAIRIRVLGQSSETLLSLLDQSLASWYLALPPHLQYNPASKKVPPPHILSLHLQFYSSLILLHRPFIPGQNSTQSPGNFPSHSICTTSAHAIANIVTTWRKTFTLRQCPPFLTYPIFSAAIICVYNASFDEALAGPAKIHLLQCMNALKEMELIWGSAIRQWELLHGLVDLRDAELGAELAGLNSQGGDTSRGTKRPTMDVDEPLTSAPSSAAFNDLRPTNFHNRPMGGRSGSKPSATRRHSSSGSRARPPAPSSGAGGPRVGVTSPSIPENQPLFPAPAALQSPPLGNFAVPMPPSLGGNASTFPNMQQQHSQLPPFAQQAPPMAMGAEGMAQTMDILNPQIDLSQFRSRPGSSSGPTNFSDLLNSFLTPTEAASTSGVNPFAFIQCSQNAQPSPGMPINMTSPGGQSGPSALDPTMAFFGMPLGANLGDDWFNYSYNAFASTSDQGGTPESQGAAGATPGSSSSVPGSAPAPAPPQRTGSVPTLSQPVPPLPQHPQQQQQSPNRPTS